MKQMFASDRRMSCLLTVASLAAGLGTAQYAAMAGQTQIPTTIEDFFVGGTQPLELIDPMESSLSCIICHGIQFPGLVEVAPNWQGSMMAQASRDPLFYACLTIANQDVKDVGDLCIRCHSPMAWLDGRSEPTDASAFIDSDRDGVTCHTCHRMVDPVFQPGVSPPEDEAILADILDIPVRPGTGGIIFDPLDRRRGPFNFKAPFIPPHPVPDGNQFIQSPFHQTSELCAACHDVSNPAYTRVGDDYVLGTLDSAHPTGDQYDMFPVERTYSEWLNSDYPNGVDTGGVFGGNLMGDVRTCQDCHMEDRQGNGCNPDDFGFPARPDMPRHDFAGGNSWIRDTLVELWPLDAIPNAEDWQARLTEGQDLSIAMLQRAATLDISQDGARASVRITNESGHKLPTGYPEGRRMWLNVQFFDAADQLITERGYYNTLSADLDGSDTKVYEIHLGLDAAVAAASGLPEGISLHFALNNKVYKDNRIPPRGFTNAAYDAFGGKPVDATYADGQYWDDTLYALPEGSASATVRLYYQTSSKEYIEFLRDENVTNHWGQTLYDAWEMHGKSAPVLMATKSIDLTGFVLGDWDGDSDSDLADFEKFEECVTGPDAGSIDVGCEVFDFDTDQDVDFSDLRTYLLHFTGD